MEEAVTKSRPVAPDSGLWRAYVPAILLLAATFFCAWPVVRGMATTSLWNDEIFSISRYSSNGPLYTLTTYHQPNNHIFFNLLNSVTPGQDRYQPFRARFWSYLLTASTCLALLIYQARAGDLYAGSLQSFFFLANLNYLDLALQARGYCLLALAATACVILTWDYFRRPSLWSLIGIPLAVWIGTWSVPTFILFGASLFFVLLCYTRDWRWIPSGAAALCLCCVVYWPVRMELLHASSTYAGEWGKAFADWRAIGEIFNDYFVFGGHSWGAFLLVAATVIVFLVQGLETEADRAGFCLGVAIVCTLAACLEMETPMKRTVAFLVMPFGFIMVTAFSKSLRALQFAAFRVSVMYGIAVIALAHGVHVFSTFHYVPYEAWMETADKVKENFAKGTWVFAPFRPDRLSPYLSKDYPLTKRLHPARAVAGKEIVVDSAFTDKQRLSTDHLPPGYSVLLVPQRRGHTQKIYYWPGK